jgi:hypothetical protein
MAQDIKIIDPRRLDERDFNSYVAANALIEKLVSNSELYVFEADANTSASIIGLMNQTKTGSIQIFIARQHIHDRAIQYHEAFHALVAQNQIPANLLAQLVTDNATVEKLRDPEFISNYREITGSDINILIEEAIATHLESIISGNADPSAAYSNLIKKMSSGTLNFATPETESAYRLAFAKCPYEPITETNVPLGMSAISVLYATEKHALNRDQLRARLQSITQIYTHNAVVHIHDRIRNKSNPSSPIATMLQQTEAKTRIHITTTDVDPIQTLGRHIFDELVYRNEILPVHINAMLSIIDPTRIYKATDNPPAQFVRELRDTFAKWIELDAIERGLTPRTKSDMAIPNQLREIFQDLTKTTPLAEKLAPIHQMQRDQMQGAGSIEKYIAEFTRQMIAHAEANPEKFISQAYDRKLQNDGFVLKHALAHKDPQVAQMLDLCKLENAALEKAAPIAIEKIRQGDGINALRSQNPHAAQWAEHATHEATKWSQREKTGMPTGPRVETDSLGRDR